MKVSDINGIKRYLQRNAKNDHRIDDKKEWFDEKDHVTFFENFARLDDAKNLAIRKDAVVGHSMVIQVGNQTDWRENPTLEFPNGKPKIIDKSQFKSMANEILKWAEEKYTKENIVSLELHLDESTPHFHLVTTPIDKENKLRHKSFIDSKFEMVRMRKTLHEKVNSVIPCTYVEGNTEGVGLEHNKNLSSKSKAVNTVLKLVGKDPLAKEYEALKEQNRLLVQKNEALKQAARQRQKGAFKRKALDEAQENSELWRKTAQGQESQASLEREKRKDLEGRVAFEVSKTLATERAGMALEREKLKKEREALEAKKNAPDELKQAKEELLKVKGALVEMTELKNIFKDESDGYYAALKENGLLPAKPPFKS
jgi:hypothetical protein